MAQTFQTDTFQGDSFESSSGGTPATVGAAALSTTGSVSAGAKSAARATASALSTTTSASASGRGKARANASAVATTVSASAGGQGKGRAGGNPVQAAVTVATGVRSAARIGATPVLASLSTSASRKAAARAGAVPLISTVTSNAGATGSAAGVPAITGAAALSATVGASAGGGGKARPGAAALIATTGSSASARGRANAGAASLASPLHLAPVDASGVLGPSPATVGAAPLETALELSARGPALPAAPVLTGGGPRVVPQLPPFERRPPTPLIKPQQSAMASGAMLPALASMGLCLARGRHAPAAPPVREPPQLIPYEVIREMVREVEVAGPVRAGATVVTPPAGVVVSLAAVRAKGTRGLSDEELIALLAEAG